MWATVKNVMDVSFTKTDTDGLIVNNGTPDQTYDTWIMVGPSAYCCSLWVASLAVCCRMAEILHDHETMFKNAYEKAIGSYYAKLWNGSYFDFDSSGQSHAKCIMADQLAGYWYLALSGLPSEVYRKDSVSSVLKLIYKANVQSYKGGSMGAVNGMMPDGKVDVYCNQSE